MNNASVLLVGAGNMAIDYAKVLLDMGIPTTVVGRGIESARIFKNSTNMPVVLGGIDEWLKNSKEHPSYTIVAVGVEELCNVTCALLKKGYINILLEKPGGLNYSEIKLVAQEAKRFNANILIAYNRRFYSSVLEAKRIIKEDGGVNSFLFEFTEWSHVIENLKKNPEILQNWLLGNSTHVIDLAFYLDGNAKKMNSYSGGKLKWHPNGCIFVGAGISEKGAFFSYLANWDAPGRWSVEIMTENNRLIFRPLEKLKIQKKASIEINEIEIDNDLDIKFKPGLYREVSAFLNEDYSEFLNIYQQLPRLKFYDKILKGSNH